MIVHDRHFAYLKLQKGSLDHLAHDRAAWQRAYEKALQEDFAVLSPYLPPQCDRLLDVGSGLGGIDALINRSYGGAVAVRLLDGVDDAPVMRLHRETYNDMEVAEDFLNRNGVHDFDYYAADAPQLGDPVTFDLIISLGSWCFHYPPETYLDFVCSVIGLRSRLILDVRRDKSAWREMLERHFDATAIALSRPKFDRIVFVPRGS